LGIGGAVHFFLFRAEKKPEERRGATGETAELERNMVIPGVDKRQGAGRLRGRGFLGRTYVKKSSREKGP